MNAQSILDQLRSIIADLIKISLCNRQNFPSERTLPDGITEISFKGANKISSAMRNQPYVDIYDELERNDAYSIKMLDGALIQMLYRFAEGDVISHRLAFFPSPHLAEFQNEPEVYELDEIFADIVMKNIVPFPLRFDFDASDENFKELVHPKSHLTLGQYKNCRIPVTSPLTPFQFISFILRSFYNTAHRKYSHEIIEFAGGFADTIGGKERDVVHVQIPQEA